MWHEIKGEQKAEQYDFKGSKKSSEAKLVYKNLDGMWIYVLNYTYARNGIRITNQIMLVEDENGATFQFMNLSNILDWWNSRLMKNQWHYEIFISNTWKRLKAH